MIKKIIVFAALVLLFSGGFWYLYSEMNITEKIDSFQRNNLNNDTVKTTTTSESLSGACAEYIEIAGSVVTYRIDFNTCSKNKPNYCINGSLISNCRLCGCENGQACNQNGECEEQNDDAMMGGGVAGVEKEEAEEEAGETKKQQTSGCYDSDSTNNPSPIYESGFCSDETGTFYDACQDPAGGASTIWIKDYRCQKTGNKTLCVGDFKSCPSSSQNYFGDPNSECSLDKCTTPTVIATCSDGIKNQDETEIDCGGVCGGYYYNNVCNPSPQATCSDGLLNQDETETDCGGVCPPCQVLPSCGDGIQNQGELGVDCGGPCLPCTGGGDEEPSDECYSEPLDSQGLTIFINSACHDETGTYHNSCTSPIGGQINEIFIKTYKCINNICTATYSSCPLEGETYFNDNTYLCQGGFCTN